MSRFTSPAFLRQAGENHARATPPPSVDLTRPNLARLHSFHLKGKDHFEVDRELAGRTDRAAPGFQEVVLGERAFLQRAVRHMAEGLGVRQFLQFGVGLPAPGDPHDVVQDTVPDARFLYVSDDPVVLAHHRALLRDGRTCVTFGSLTDPGALLRSADLLGFLDLSRPVGLLLCGTVAHIPTTASPGAAIGTLRDALAPGSRMALSHYCRPDPGVYPKDALRAEHLEQVFVELLGTGWWRSRSEIESFFTGWRLEAPGLIEVQRWRTLPVAPHIPGSYQMPRRNRRLALGGLGSV